MKITRFLLTLGTWIISGLFKYSCKKLQGVQKLFLELGRYSWTISSRTQTELIRRIHHDF